MNRTNYFYHCIAFLGAWILLASLCPAQVQVSSRLSSRFLARGEQALLEISFIGSKPNQYPIIPDVMSVDIRPTGRVPQVKVLPDRRIAHVFEYLVSSYQVGNHTIPSIEVQTPNESLKTEPLDFLIFNPDELQWSEAKFGNTPFRYASTFRVLNTAPYEGETIPVEIKIFVPRDLLIVDWGIPDFQRDGVTAWRFQPSEMRSQINLLGVPYTSVAYPSTLTPTQSGKISIGPAKVRLVTTQVVMDGFMRRVSIETKVDVPRLELTAQSLPPGAPEGFKNAVGNFKIQVSTPTVQVQEGDPIPLEVRVTGTGNLDTLLPPEPLHADGWKLYEASPQQRGDERREASGTTVFSQFIRPLELKSTLPSFKLVFFNPKTQTYETASSEPISLLMTPAPSITENPVASSGPPPVRSTPIEEMTDILGLIPQGVSNDQISSKIPSWMIHIIGAVFALLLITKAIWMRVSFRLNQSPAKSASISDLKSLEQQSQLSDHEFLMAAGRFIERWHGDTQNPELHAILSQRDLSCFQPEASTQPALPSQRRATILKILRKSVLTSIIGFMAIFTNHAQASSASDSARTAYESKQYGEAIQAWLNSGSFESLSPNTLYHIGNAYYRAGSPGNAALYYRRALARNPSHQEARQNLRFIERKYGVITFRRPDFQYAISQIPLSVWKNSAWAGIWLCALALLTFAASRPRANIRILAIVALVIGPIIAATAALGLRYFPDDAQFSPLANQAVVIAEKSVLYTEASRESSEVIQAPPGSLCEVIYQSGNWAYVGFDSRTRGWLPAESIEKITPLTPPSTPKIRKPSAQKNNA